MAAFGKMLVLLFLLRGVPLPSLTIPINPTNNPTLVKGSGFSGATAQPSAVGNSGAAGYSENAIARWNVVPYQTFAGTLKVGVVAFHIEGILGVAFSVEGGNWSFCHTPATNSDSGTVEYWCSLNASDFSDGQIEVRAVVYLVSGVPRVLQGSDYTATVQSLYLYANSGGTYNPTYIYCDGTGGSDSNNGLTTGAPVQSLDKALDLVSDGGIVQIQTAGNYAIDTPNTSPRYAFNYAYNHWTTILPKPGLAQSAVVLNSGGRSRINHLRIYGITIDAHGAEFYPEVGYQAWADHVAFYNSVGWTEETSDGPLRNNQSGGTFATDCSTTNMFFGLVGTNLVRNYTATKMSGDIISGVTCAINVTVSNGRQMVAGSHNDVFQIFGPHQNNIVYGLTATDMTSFQGFFFDKDQSSSFQDIAIVNANIAVNDGNGPPFTQFAASERHILLQNVVMPTQTMLWRTDFVPDGAGNSVPFSGTNFKLVNCTVNNATFGSLPTPAPGVTATGTVNSGL